MAGNAHRKPFPGVHSYRADPLYPTIARAGETILEHGEVVSPVDVVVGMRLLTPEDLENWHRGRVRKAGLFYHPKLI